jgi:hypothetical protein
MALLLLLLLLLLFLLLLVVVVVVSSFSYHRFYFPWYFSSCASGESHHSVFESQDYSTFFMMCDVPSTAFSVENLSTFVVVLFPDVF